MSRVLALLGVVGMWLVWELLGELIFEAVLRPLFSFFEKLISGTTVLLLWIAALASVLWFSQLASGSTDTRAWPLIAFLTLSPAALSASFVWRDKRCPAPVSAQEHPATRVLAGVLAALCAITLGLFTVGGLRELWWADLLMLCGTIIFGGVALRGRVPGAGVLRALRSRRSP